jgi:hypothetical protein
VGGDEFLSVDGRLTLMVGVDKFLGVEKVMGGGNSLCGWFDQFLREQWLIGCD